jgi:hypothetical protein
MNTQSDSSASVSPVVVEVPADEAMDTSISELVGDIYQAAPPDERGRLLEQLLRPLAILSLFDVAGGAFVKPRMRGGWQDLHIRLEDIQGIRASDVVALVDHARQVSVEAVDGLAELLPALPVTSGSAHAVLLIAALVEQARPGARERSA